MCHSYAILYSFFNNVSYSHIVLLYSFFLIMYHYYYTVLSYSMPTGITFLIIVFKIHENFFRWKKKIL